MSYKDSVLFCHGRAFGHHIFSHNQNHHRFYSTKCGVRSLHPKPGRMAMAIRPNNDKFPYFFLINRPRILIITDLAMILMEYEKCLNRRMIL